MNRITRICERRKESVCCY